MSMIRWDPFADMAQLREQVDRLFEQSLSHVGHEATCPHCWAPPVDILETDAAVLVRVEIPGIDPDAVEIQIVGETLTIKGERKPLREEGKRYVRVERPYGPFQRAFTLTLPIDQQAVCATCRDGVLDITLPKAETPRPKQVKVDVQTAPRSGEEF